MVIQEKVVQALPAKIFNLRESRLQLYPEWVKLKTAAIGAGITL
jgi:hypothetical protein